MTCGRLVAVVLLVVDAFGGSLFAQTPAAQTLRFEAASVERNRSDEGAYLPGRVKGQTFFAANVVARHLRPELDLRGRA
jgi:hypothetical protein